MSDETVIEHLERLMAATMPGRWEAVRVSQGVQHMEAPESGWAIPYPGLTAEDQAAIVAVHNAFPALLAVVKAAMDDGHLRKHADECDVCGALAPLLERAT